MSDKRRLDALLVERGLAETRARAQALVMAGAVWSGDRRLDKPGVAIAADTPLELRGRDHPWVSRGGVKLAHALDHFAIDPAGALAAPAARLVALIKPQFEVGPARVGKGGVVRDPALHREVCERIVAWLAAQ